MPSKRVASIGLRAHSGWAALVSIIGPVDAPVVISRKRLIIADPGFPGSKQPYHFVESMSLSEASGIVADCRKSSLELAARAIAGEMLELKQKGFEAKTCGVLQGRTTEMPPLAKIRAAHPQLHTAEGILFRQIVMLAAQECGLRVRGVPEHNLEEQVLVRLGVGMDRLTEMGHGLGSPWTVDQKFSAAAAWLVFASEHS